ncbi:MAG TPA: hypothetical protein VI456_11760 [Polyangia bacterium]
MRWLQCALGVLVLATIPRPVAADDDAPVVTEAPCPLGKPPQAGKLVTTVEKEACGSGGCTQARTRKLADADGTTLIRWSDDVSGDFEQPSPLAIDCRAGAVVVKDEKGDVLTLSYDVGAHRLRLPSSIRRQVEGGWHAPPASGPAAIARARLADVLDALVAQPENPDDPPPSTVVDLDSELVQSHWLLVARDRLRAGDWESAETILNAVPTKPPLTPVVAQRRRVVTEALAALRTQTTPVVASDRRRVGTVPSRPTTPLVADAVPNLFWRNDSLCVAQGDHAPPIEMRCLDAATHKWGTREPLQKPRSSGEHLRSMIFGNVTRCDGVFVVQKTVPKSDQDSCTGGPGEDAGQLVGVVDGDAMLLATPGAPRMRINRGPEKSKGLTAQEADALLASSAGSLVLGGACCRFVDEARIARLDDKNGEHQWPILGPPPKGQQWSGPPLVSPSQSWVIAFSTAATTPPVTLWLFRLSAPR